MVYNHLGFVHQKRQKPYQALAYYERALDLFEALGDTLGGIDVLNNMGSLYMSEEKYKPALKVLEEAAQRAAAIQAPVEEKEACWQVSQLLERQGHYQEALAYYKRYNQLMEIIFDQARSQQIAKMQAQYDAERKAREAEIYQLRNVALEQEIAERKRVETALLASKEAAEAANLAKSEFLSKMSHELRTPLNGILGHTQILRRQPQLDPQQIQQAIDVIHESGEHLLMLINDILDIAKIEARRLDLRPHEVDLPQFLDNLVKIMQIQAKQKGLNFVHEANALPSRVWVDGKRLRQVLFNLLGNAFKFTFTGAVTLKVHNLTAKPTDRDQCCLHFEVIDTGIGITTEALTRIFLPFEQVNNGDRYVEGTGLGLSISQQLVQRMGSQIKVNSQVGKGSCFWFDLILPVAKHLQTAVPHTVGTHSSWLSNKTYTPNILHEIIMPSTNAITTLYQLALMGDLQAMDKQLEKLIQEDNTLTPFTQKMKQLIDAYEVETIIELLETIVISI